MNKHPRAFKSSGFVRRGAILPMFAVFIPLILAIGAFAVNVAWMSLVDSEMQIAADTSARASGTEFTRTQNLLNAQNRAKEAIQQNKVGGRVLTLTDSEIVFGESPLVTAASPVGIAAFTPKTVTQGTLGSGPGQTWINAIQINKQQTFGFAEMPMPIPFLSSNGFTPGASATTTQFERDIVLVLDRSGSMNEYSTDFASWGPAGPGEAYYASRWRELTAAIQTFNDFLDLTPLNEQVALATFSTSASEDVVFSTDLIAVETRLHDITGNFQGGMTAIGDGIAAGINLITDSTRSRTFAKRTMIVMTDGIQNTGTPPRVKARLAHDNYGITVHCITFSDGADQVEGALIASEGGGNHYHASSGSALSDIFEEIAKTLPTMLSR